MRMSFIINILVKRNNFFCAGPIDCDDHCHLAWLLRDNPQFLERIAFGQCANGTRFESLDPAGFTDCP